MPSGRDDRHWAEKHARDVDLAHAAGAATIAHAADLLHPRFIYLSNSYVFDGTKRELPRRPTSFSATSALGKAKLAGENYIRGRSLNYIIVRSSPLFGRASAQGALGDSFLDRLRMALDRGRAHSGSRCSNATPSRPSRGSAICSRHSSRAA